MSESLTGMMKDLQSGTSVMLRTENEMYMPALAALAKEGFDASKPAMRMVNELVEISSDPVPASLFEIPRDYQSVPAAEIFRDCVTKTAAAFK